jgi:hypothetical protein
MTSSPSLLLPATLGAGCRSGRTPSGTSTSWIRRTRVSAITAFTPVRVGRGDPLRSLFSIREPRRDPTAAAISSTEVAGCALPEGKCRRPACTARQLCTHTFSRTAVPAAGRAPIRTPQLNIKLARSEMHAPCQLQPCALPNEGATAAVPQQKWQQPSRVPDASLTLCSIRLLTHIGMRRASQTRPCSPNTELSRHDPRRWRE